MDNETTVRMFWTGDTPTVPKGWYEVTLKKRSFFGIMILHIFVYLLVI